MKLRVLAFLLAVFTLVALLAAPQAKTQQRSGSAKKADADPAKQFNRDQFRIPHKKFALDNRNKTVALQSTLQYKVIRRESIPVCQ
ncbi:MAG: hypothetical protein LC775_19390 [Acidobacteria bacterium]|nr:hypothetical protein [Acidobacteriota bacterium]